MENASKALIMVASFLISVIILSLAIYLFTTFGAQAAEVREENAKQQLRKFNEQFTIYEQQSGSNTVYDVVTAANVAKNSNEYYGFIIKENGVYKSVITPKLNGDDNYIAIRLNNEQIESKSTDYYNELLKNNTESLYACTVQISSVTGRVYIVNFTEVPN